MLFICSKIPGRIGDYGDNLLERLGTEEHDELKADRAVAFVEVTHPKLFEKQCKQ